MALDVVGIFLDFSFSFSSGFMYIVGRGPVTNAYDEGKKKLSRS